MIWNAKKRKWENDKEMQKNDFKWTKMKKNKNNVVYKEYTHPKINAKLHGI